MNLLPKHRWNVRNISNTTETYKSTLCIILPHILATFKQLSMLLLKVCKLLLPLHVYQWTPFSLCLQCLHPLFWQHFKKSFKTQFIMWIISWLCLPSPHKTTASFFGAPFHQCFHCIFTTQTTNLLPY